MRKVTKLQLRLFPELTLVDDEATQLALLKRTHSWWRTLIRSCVAIVPTSVGGALIGTTISDMLAPYPMLMLAWEPVFVVLLTCLQIVFVLYLVRRPTRLELRHELNKSGIRVCIACGYDMRGLPRDRCPECGTVAEPVASRERREGKL